MAGIGFRLEKILSKDSYTHLLQGYAYSAIVSAGPLLFTIFSIAILGIISMAHISVHDIITFRTLVVYIYGISLITSSPAQMIITRYMADRIFLEDYKAIVPSFIGVIIISIILHAIIGYIGIQFLDLGFGVEVTAVVLFINVGTLWIAMIVLSAAKEFTKIVRSFAYTSVLGVVTGYFLGKYLGLIGLVVGFTLGHCLLVILLTVQIFNEFEYRKRIEFYFLEYFKKYAALGFISLLYNIGIWSDKFIFWFSPETSVEVHSFLRAAPVYDAPVFLAYLLIVPTLAMFTIKIETSFYYHYKKYFLAILNKHPYYAIEERRKNIVSDLKLSLGRLIVMQGTITLAALLFAPKIYTYLKLSSMNLGIFHIVILATFLQALLHVLLIIMLYFDFRTDALIMSASFAVSNILLTLLSIHMGFSYYGYGYFGACLTALTVGFALFNYRLRSLNYYTFVGQKIVHTETA